jgi:hypothetical protein
VVLEHAGAEVPNQQRARLRCLGPEHGRHQNGEAPYSGQPGSRARAACSGRSPRATTPAAARRTRARARSVSDITP